MTRRHIYIYCIVSVNLDLPRVKDRDDIEDSIEVNALFNSLIWSLDIRYPASECGFSSLHSALADLVALGRCPFYSNMWLAFNLHLFNLQHQDHGVSRQGILQFPQATPTVFKVNFEHLPCQVGPRDSHRRGNTTPLPSRAIFPCPHWTCLQRPVSCRRQAWLWRVLDKLAVP